MVDLEKQTSDTLITPDQDVTEEMQLEGSSNDTDHNQFTGADEENSLGDGVPGYETTGEDGTDDDLEQQQQMTNKPTPHP